MKTMINMMMGFACLAFLSSCGSKGQDHNDKVLEEMRKLTAAVKSIHEAKEEDVEQVTSKAMSAIEQFGVAMEALNKNKENVAGVTVEQRAAFDAELANIQEQLTSELETLAVKNPKVGMKVSFKITEVTAAFVE